MTVIVMLRDSTPQCLQIVKSVEWRNVMIDGHPSEQQRVLACLDDCGRVIATFDEKRLIGFRVEPVA